MTDYYAILGVGREDSVADIRKRFRVLSMSCHPDKGGDEDAYRVMVEAYTVLCDESLRKEYDDRLRRLRSVPRVKRTESEKVWADVYVALADAVRGCQKTVEYGKSCVTAPVRAGVSDGEEVLCGRCGQVEVWARIHIIMDFGYSFERYRNGRVLTLSVSVPRERLGKPTSINLLGDPVRVTIPASTPDGGYVKLRNMGYPDGEGGRGYLYIKVNIREKDDIPNKNNIKTI